jgi:type II secretory ATPase GspE/PulE/Tfp pilus assembly ATPase PilB-like protein
MTTSALLAQASVAILVSWWKALLILLPFIAWARLVSSHLEKDARYFHLPWLTWNAIHLAAGAVALVVMLLVPIFWIGWPLGVLVLVGPVLAYWKIRNAAVPESRRFYLTTDSFSSALQARRQAKASRDAAIQFIDANGAERRVPLKDEPLFASHMLAEDLIGPAIAARAGRIEVAISPKGCAVAQIIDGVRYRRDGLAVESAIRLIDYLKDVAGLDVEDRRRQQAGNFRLRSPAGSSQVHIDTAGSSNTQVMRLDFDRHQRLNKPFDGLGLLEPQMEALRGIVQPQDRHGIVLVAAPAGQGLSTSMYSLVARHDAFTSNIKSLERDIEVDLDGVDQMRWDPANPDIDYATQLQSILRRDPDVVMIAEIHDHETARVASEPGMQGPLMYIPQRAASIPEQFRLWVKQVGDVKQAIKPLRVVMNQRLLRTLCPQCRQAYQPSAEQLRKLGIPGGRVKELYRPSGKIQVKNKIEDCPVCGGTGYLGQTGIFEVMVVDEEARKLIIGNDLKAALAHARRSKMIYMQEAAMMKVVSGETSIDEVVRVTAPKQAAKSAARAAAPPPAAKPIAPTAGG